MTLAHEYKAINSAKCYDLWSYLQDAANADSFDFLNTELLAEIGEGTIGDESDKDALVQMAVDLVDWASVNEELFYWSYVKFDKERHAQD